MVQLFKNGFFEACKVRLVFDMGRRHIPDHPHADSRLNRGQTRFN